MRMHPVLKV